MLRPLVLPKFHTSRGQAISPGVSLLATGGPKQRGKLVVPNPHLLRNAEGWDANTDPCSATTLFDGRVEVNNLTEPGACTVLGADATETLEADTIYQFIVNVVSMSGNGDLFVRFGGTNIPVSIDSSGTYLFYDSVSFVSTQTINLQARLATAFNTVVDYFGVSEVRLA